MAKVRHRVIVQLTETDNDKDPCMIPMRKLDNFTLQLKNKRQMSFDFVGMASDARSEVNAIMDQVMFQCNNCCLIRFSVERFHNIPFLTTLVVSEVEKRLQVWRAIVQSITVEYYDLRKFDVVDMISSYARMRRAPIRNQFRTTTELCDWLTREFYQMWCYGLGHDCLDFTFSFADSLRQIHEVKFTVIHMNLRRMDASERASMLDFLKHLDGKEKPKHSMVTDSIREYFNGIRNWQTCFMFNVPWATAENKASEDILRYANAAYYGINSLKALEEANIYKLH